MRLAGIFFSSATSVNTKTNDLIYEGIETHDNRRVRHGAGDYDRKTNDLIYEGIETNQTGLAIPSLLPSDKTNDLIYEGIETVILLIHTHLSPDNKTNDLIYEGIETQDSEYSEASVGNVPKQTT